MKRILVLVPEGQVKLLAELVSERFYANRNEAIREAVRLLLKEHRKF